MKKKTLQNLLIALLFTVVAVYILFQFIRTNTDSVSMQTAVITEFSENVYSTVTIFKDEKLITNNTPGTLVYLVSDGERVGKNESVCSIYPSNTNISNMYGAETLKKKRDVYKLSNMSYLSAVASLDSFDEDTKDNYLQMIRSLAAYDYEDAEEFGNQALITMNKRLIATGKVKNFDSKIKELDKRIKELSTSLEKPVSNITVSESGYFSKQADGYEDIFKTDLLQSMTIEDYDALMERSPDPVDENVIGKLSNEYKWHFVCKVDAQSVSQLNTGDTFPISFCLYGGDEVMATLERKIEQPKNKDAVLVFVSREFPKDFNFRRFQDIILKSKEYSGIRFSSEAIRVIDGVTGVFVNHKGHAEFRSVEIIYTSDNYSISAISKEADEKYPRLQAGENVIVTGNDIFEGKIID